MFIRWHCIKILMPPTIKLEDENDTLAVQQPEKLQQCVQTVVVVEVVLQDVVGLLLQPVRGAVHRLVRGDL